MKSIQLVTTDDKLNSAIHAVLYAAYQHATKEIVYSEESLRSVYSILNSGRRYDLVNFDKLVVDEKKFQEFVFGCFILEIDITITMPGAFEFARKRAQIVAELPIMVEPVQLVPFIVKLYESYLKEFYPNKYDVPDLSSNGIAELKRLFGLI